MSPKPVGVRVCGLGRGLRRIATLTPVEVCDDAQELRLISTAITFQVLGER